MSITLRDILPEDEPFLFEVYASTRMQDLEPVPWDDDQKRSFLTQQFDVQHTNYQERFPHASYCVILRDDLPLGRLYVQRAKQEIHILDIAILPEHRNSGIGTALLRDLLDEAAKSGKRVLIYVETFNPSLPLFERLGFKSVAQEGFNFLMEWHSAK